MIGYILRLSSSLVCFFFVLIVVALFMDCLICNCLIVIKYIRNCFIKRILLVIIWVNAHHLVYWSGMWMNPKSVFHGAEFTFLDKIKVSSCVFDWIWTCSLLINTIIDLNPWFIKKASAHCYVIVRHFINNMWNVLSNWLLWSNTKV